MNFKKPLLDTIATLNSNLVNKNVIYRAMKFFIFVRLLCTLGILHRPIVFDRTKLVGG